MRFVFLAVLLLSGCVHEIGLNGAQQCATRGMVMQGESHVTAAATVPTGGSSRTVTAEFNSVICAVPQSDSERCAVWATQEMLGPVYAFDGTLKGKNLLIGCGYWLWVVPGVWYYYRVDDERKDAIAKSHEIFQERFDRCRKEKTAH